jgi:DNA-directed RNA polymerase subunit N (RpoN/RPB10)
MAVVVATVVSLFVDCWLTVKVVADVFKARAEVVDEECGDDVLEMRAEVVVDRDGVDDCCSRRLITGNEASMAMPHVLRPLRASLMYPSIPQPLPQLNEKRKIHSQ